MHVPLGLLVAHRDSRRLPRSLAPNQGGARLFKVPRLCRGGRWETPFLCRPLSTGPGPGLPRVLPLSWPFAGSSVAADDLPSSEAPPSVSLLALPQGHLPSVVEGALSLQPEPRFPSYSVLL